MHLQSDLYSKTCRKILVATEQRKNPSLFLLVLPWPCCHYCHWWTIIHYITYSSMNMVTDCAVLWWLCCDMVNVLCYGDCTVGELGYTTSLLHQHEWPPGEFFSTHNQVERIFVVQLVGRLVPCFGFIFLLAGAAGGTPRIDWQLSHHCRGCTARTESWDKRWERQVWQTPDAVQMFWQALHLQKVGPLFIYRSPGWNWD